MNIPTGGALRASSTTAALCIKCGRLVMSTTALGVSTIPTGIIFLSLRISYIIMIMHIASINEVQYMIMINMLRRLPTGFFKNSFRSQDLFGDSSKDGWRIASSGSVGSLGDHYVYDSYGCIISPRKYVFRSPWSTNTNDDSAFCVDSGGSVGINISILVVANSDGR